MTTEPKSIAVLGGGMLGQALALRLRESGYDVTIFEAAPSGGGLAGAWTVGGVTTDCFYHVILPADSRLVSLLDELGLSDEVVWKKAQTGFCANGRMSPLNSSLDYLRLPSLGLIAKIRIALTLMMAARIRDGAPLEQIPVADWLSRWCGRSAFEALWRPLLSAKLGENYKIASAGFIWATIRRLYLARNTGAKTETLGFVRGGYARILTALSRRLNESGVRLVTGAHVSRVAPEADGLRVETGDGKSMEFDQVVSTLPAGVTAQVCEGLSPEITKRLEGVVYQGIICATVVLDRPLSPYYLTYLTDDGLPFTAIVETSALTGTEQFDGRHVVYLPRYVTQTDDFWDLDDDTVRARFETGLARIHPDFRPEHIVDFRLARVRNVMAVPTLGYSDTAPQVATNIAGLSIASSAQITDGTLNVDATLGVIETALPVILGEAGSSKLRAAA